jgi:hypothetical protein
VALAGAATVGGIVAQLRAGTLRASQPAEAARPAPAAAARPPQ